MRIANFVKGLARNGRVLAMVAIIGLLFAVLPLEKVFADVVEEEFKVYVRVESSHPEQEGTLLFYTEVVLTEPNPETGTYSPLRALKLAVDGDLTVEYSEYGAYITSVCGLSDDTGRMAWMYAVNDEQPWEGVDQYALQNGDEVVFYFVDWQEGAYAYFTPSTVLASPGKPFKLTLNSLHFTDGILPVENAELLIEAPEGSIMPLLIYYTDENGDVEITLPQTGRYTVTARKMNEDGIYVISRPLARVSVLDLTITLPDGERLDEVSVSDVTLVMPDSPTPPTAIQITPALMLDPETGKVWLYGVPVEIDEAFLPVLENGVVLVPVRAIAEALGATVEWEPKTALATITLNDIRFSFTPGQLLGGVPVKIINDRAYASADFLIKQFELESVFLLP